MSARARFKSKSIITDYRLDALGVELLWYDYDPTKPNIIYTGHGITHDLHLGHKYHASLLKRVSSILNAPIFFMFSRDEKQLQLANVETTTIQRVKQYYQKELTNVQFHDTIEDITPAWYAHALYFAQYIKPTLLRKALGETENIGNYYYAPMQCAPLIAFQKYNVFVYTAPEQLPYFSLAHKVLQHNKKSLANYILIEPILNTQMNGKMSSRGKDVIFLTESAESLKKKIMGAKSYGHIICQLTKYPLEDRSHDV